MKMTPALVVIGGLMVFWCSVIIAVILPAMTINEKPSELWRPWTAKEAAGHDLYVRNGCSYSHSQFVRVMDSDLGSERIAQKGDYVGYTPAILGTERTSQFAVNTVQFSLRNTDWESLKRFYLELSRRSPYIGLEQFSLTVTPGNPTLLNAMLRVSSVEIVR